MKYLVDSGYEAHFEPPSETFNFGEIWINLTGEIILKVFIKTEQIPTETSLVQGSPLHFVHFFIALDHQVEKSLFSDAARYVALLNKVIPIGAFGFSEADRAFVFKYAFPTKEVDPTQLDVIISLIHYAIDLYAPTLKNFNGIDSFLSQSQLD